MLHPGGELGKLRVPKKETAINPINPRGELAIPGRKLSVSRSILVRSRRRLAGWIAPDSFYTVVFFLYFISNIFFAILFKPSNKIMVM